MKLKILTWNLNFFYDNWYNRIISINKVLEKEISTNDIIVLQEATIPYLKTPGSIYTCLKKTCLDYTYHHTFSDEVKILSDKLKSYYPEKEKKIMTLFAYFMDKLLLVSSYFFSKFGHILQKLYFTYPVICFIFSVILFPIIIFGGYMFLGMMTIVNKKIKTTVKSKFVGRLFQYCEFTYNKKDVLLCNLHLNEGNDPNKGFKEFQKILDFIKLKKADVVILAGDFNSPPTSKMYKQLSQAGFKSTIKEINGKDLKTWPSLNPTTCIDYIWVKGDDVEICKAEVFGDNNSTDHKGVKCCIDIK
jgi:endonuclease/exonuclease/phosphatase family metal-dependent hydrolase